MILKDLCPRVQIEYSYYEDPQMELFAPDQKEQPERIDTREEGLDWLGDLDPAFSPRKIGLFTDQLVLAAAVAALVLLLLIRFS